MTKRERALAALERRRPDRTPRHVRFTPPMLERFRERTGSDDPETYYDLELTYSVEAEPLAPCDDAEARFARYLPERPRGTRVDSFGRGFAPGDFYHFTRIIHPLRDLDHPAQLDDYPWPAWASEPSDDLRQRVGALRAQDRFVVGDGGSIWETAWQMRGMDRLFFDMAEQPSLATRLLDGVAAARCGAARGLAAAGVDMLRIVDDVGMQDRLMMSPQMWRTWLKPRLAQLIAAAREVHPRVFVQYHSDGWIEPLIEDLIEVGVDLLDPVQPECMDPADLKRRFGDRLSFFGTVGTQTTMPHGSPAEVTRVVRERIGAVGAGGGLIIAPTHVLEPDVPWENVEAFLEAVAKYG
jgi:uroporphyrinogen decarboxylase